MIQDFDLVFEPFTN
jgi:uncharacterized protein YegL